MQLRLLQEQTQGDQVLPAGSVIEVEDVAGQALVDSGVAEMYTPEMAAAEETEAVKACAEEIKSEQSDTKEPNMSENQVKTFGKALQNAIQTKSVDVYAGTEATQPLGIVTLASGLPGKCVKRTIRGNLNLVYSASNVDAHGHPIIAAVGELTGAADEAPLTQYDAIPGKYLCTVAIPTEMLEDVAQMEAFVTQELNNNATLKLEECILNGAFAASKGLKGVCKSTDSKFVTLADDTLPTLPELHSMVDSVIPSLQTKAEWVISPTVWGNLKAELLDDANLNSQLISDGPNKTLLGYPVNVSVKVVSTEPIVFGDFSQYVLGMARDITIEVDRSAAFLTDAVVAKVSFRVAGGPACSLKYFDGATYGAFAVGTETPLT